MHRHVSVVVVLLVPPWPYPTVMVVAVFVTVSVTVMVHSVVVVVVVVGVGYRGLVQTSLQGAVAPYYPRGREKLYVRFSLDQHGDRAPFAWSATFVA